MEYLALCALQFESAFAHKNLTLYISNPHSPKKIQSFTLQIHIRPRKLGKGAGNAVCPPEIFTNVVCRSENNEKSRVHPPSFFEGRKVLPVEFSMWSFPFQNSLSRVWMCLYDLVIRWHREYCRVYFDFFPFFIFLLFEIFTIYGFFRIKISFKR